MEIKSNQNIFNLEALGLGILMLISCILIHALFVFFIASRARKEIVPALAAKNKTVAHMFFLAYVLILLFSHITQIFIWGVMLYCSSVIENPHTAMVYAGSTYTTVGFVSDPVANQWQLLSVFMAISGLFTFGWSASVLFALSQTLLKSD